MYTTLLESLAGDLFQEAKGLPQAEVTAQLERLLADACEAWPALGESIDAVTYAAYIGQSMMMTPPTQGIYQRLERLFPGDLYLACGCFYQREQALQLFEQEYLGLLQSVVRRYASARYTEEDFLQLLREKLFVGAEESPPKILRYAGEGPLSGWLRITATRTCLDKARRGAQQKNEFGDREHAFLNAAALDDDIELGFLKREYRSHFSEAIEQAFGGLESEHRNILRQQLLFGLNIDQIGALYHIHRSTAARRLTKARQMLLDMTREALIQKLKISSDEFESIMHLIRSNIDLSLQRLLRS